MSYNKDTDYQAKINEAVEKGDYESAAKYEKSRNEKIDSENLSYKKTNKYSGWLDSTDYSNVLKSQISSGASKSLVSDTLKKRIEKASGTVGLTQYAYDDVYDDAIKYIMGGESFSYKVAAPTYRSNVEKQLNNLYSQLVNMEEFSYDPYSDELYEYYKEQYNREGKRAMTDLLGELAANTGGVASSYAVSAASQMLDYYNSKLTDKIPELYESAYERYTDNIKRKQDNISTLADIADDEYNRYLDEVNQYNKDRELAYKAYSDALDADYMQEKLATEREAALRDYEAEMESLALEAEENNRKWEQQQYENETESYRDRVDTALEKWKQLGYLDSESAKILGLPEGLHTSDYDYKKAQQYKIYNK